MCVCAVVVDRSVCVCVCLKAKDRQSLGMRDVTVEELHALLAGYKGL